MKKQLLITTLITSFFGMAFAETPKINHDKALQTLIQLGGTEDGKKCPGLTKILPKAIAIAERVQKERRDLTDKEKKKIEKWSKGHRSKTEALTDDVSKTNDTPEKSTEEASNQ